MLENRYESVNILVGQQRIVSRSRIVVLREQKKDLFDKLLLLLSIAHIRHIYGFVFYMEIFNHIQSIECPAFPFP